MSRTAQMIITKYSPALMPIVAVFSAISGKADDINSPRFNFDRYSAMIDHSPFAIATAVALPAATPDFAKDLYVANAARSPEADMVTIASSSDQNFKKYLTTREPVDGYNIASIEWSDRVGATKVTISKDGKFATLTFNQALLSQRASLNAPLAPGQMPQSVPLAPSSGPRQASNVRVPGMIQRNQKPGAVPAPNVMPVPPPDLELPQINPQQQQRLKEQQKDQQRRRKANSELP